MYDPLTALEIARERHRDLLRAAEAERLVERVPRLGLPRLRLPAARPVPVPCTTCC